MASQSRIMEGKEILIRSLRDTQPDDLRKALWILSQTSLATRVDRNTDTEIEADVSVSALLEVNLRWFFSDSVLSPYFLRAIGPDPLQMRLMRCLLEPQRFESASEHGFAPLSPSPSPQSSVVVVIRTNARDWLDRGVEFYSSRHNSGMTALARACQSSSWNANFLEMARLLLEHGADPNACGADGVTPLMRAIKTGNASAARLLLELERTETNNAQNDDKDDDKDESQSHPQWISKWGTDLYRYDQQAMSALIHACTENHLELARELVAVAVRTGCGPRNNNKPSTSASAIANAYKVDPPVWYASAHGNTAIAKWLMDECSATTDYRKLPTVYSSTPLMEACEWGHFSCVEVLLERDGSDPRTTTGRRARALAARAGHSSIVELLDRWTARLNRLEEWEGSGSGSGSGSGGTEKIDSGSNGCPGMDTGNDNENNDDFPEAMNTGGDGDGDNNENFPKVLCLPRVLAQTAKRHGIAYRILSRNVGEILPFVEGMRSG